VGGGEPKNVPDIIRALGALESRVAALEAKVGEGNVGEEVRHMRQEVTIFRVLVGRKLNLHPAVRKALEPPKMPKELVDDLWARGLIEK